MKPNCIIIHIINQVDEIIQEALFKADKEDAQMTALRGFVDLQVMMIIITIIITIMMMMMKITIMMMMMTDKECTQIDSEAAENVNQ